MSKARRRPAAARVRHLLDERYAPPVWWTRPRAPNAPPAREWDTCSACTKRVPADQPCPYCLAARARARRSTAA